MIPLIEEIIEKFGPRPAASSAETNAQLFVESKLKAFTPHTRFQPFEEYLDARFGKLKYYCVLFFAALVLYWVAPVVALVLAAVNVFFLVFDLMMYRDVLTTFPGKKQTSSNVDAVLEPTSEVKSTIVISGHMDSTREYTWWYKLGEAGIKLTIAAGVLMLLELLFLIWHVAGPAYYHSYIWFLLLALSPITIVYWSMHGDDAVPGAQDNLSGVSIAYHVFTSFAQKNEAGKSILKNTRLRFVSFGSEEKGLCGSRAYVKQNKELLQSENAHLINIDGVRLVSEVAIVHRELMNGTRHHPVLIQSLESSFNQKNIPYKKVAIPIGGTDGVSFARAGFPSVTIIGMSASEYDFTYHTRNDLVEHIEPRSLENVKEVIANMITEWDAKP